MAIGDSEDQTNDRALRRVWVRRGFAVGRPDAVTARPV